MIILIFMVGMGLLTFKTLIDQRDITFAKIDVGQEDLTSASKVSLMLNTFHSDMYRLMNLMAIGTVGEKIQKSLADLRSQLTEIGKELHASLPQETEMHELLKGYTEKTEYALEMSEIEFTASLMLMEDAAVAYAEMNEKLNSHLDKVRGIIQGSITEGKERVRFAITLYSALFMISVVISVPAALFIANRLRKQIAQVGIGISKGGKGDLTTRIEVSSSDEIGQMANDFNNFLENQQALIGHISTSVTKVAESAEELSKITVENNNLIDDQHLATDQVASAITEMAASVKEVAQNANNAAEAAKGAETTPITGIRWLKILYPPFIHCHKT